MLSRWAKALDISSSENPDLLSLEHLLALVAELQRQVKALQEQVAELAASNRALADENEQLKRGTKRQATPFSKETRSNQPKGPGRKPGEGTFSFRQAPLPEETTQPPVNVPVTREACSGCGGTLTDQRVDFAYITDQPPLPQPKVTQYLVRVCRCTGCGRQVRVFAAHLAPDQYGATAHRVGLPPTGWGHGLWQPPMPCTTRWGFQCARCPWSWGF